MNSDKTTDPCKRHDCKRVRAEMQAVVERVQAERDTALAECNEQARLNGMGAEREARLIAQVAELRAERDALRVGIESNGCEVVDKCDDGSGPWLRNVRAERAEAERDAIVGAFGNAQLAAFIEKHGNPVPLVDELEAVKAERDALANTDAGAALALLSRMRWACGDNGKRMQDELEDYLRELARDAARYRWLHVAENYPDMDWWANKLSNTRTTEKFDATVDAAMDQSGKGGE